MPPLQKYSIFPKSLSPLSLLIHKSPDDIDTFSRYQDYFYSFNHSKKIDDIIIKDSIESIFDNVDNYEINEGNFKDIRITVTQRNLDLNIFIYDNVNKINYEFLDREKIENKENELLNEYDKVINFKNYLWTNLYDQKQNIFDLYLFYPFL